MAAGRGSGTTAIPLCWDGTKKVNAMACEHIQIPGGSMAIVCGLRRGKRQRCQFCGAPGTTLCDWKCDKPTKIPHIQLAEGDTIVTVQHKYRLKVLGLQRFAVDTAPAGRPPHPVEVTMYGLVFPDGRCWLYYQWSTGKVRGDGARGTVWVLRPGTCDAPCCELHSRSVGEDVDYCMEHWQAWESA
jgi:hypothetical protein